MYSLCLIQRRPCISTLVYHISIASTVNIDNSCCFASSGNDDICCAHLAAFNSDPERAGDDDHPLQSYKQTQQAQDHIFRRPSAAVTFTRFGEHYYICQVPKVTK